MSCDMYHTDKRPLDKSGHELRPLDLVILGDIPRHFWSDKGSERLKRFGGCYGLVTYYPSLDGVIYDPFYNRNNEHPGWVSGDATIVYVWSHRVDAEEQAVFSEEFWLPAASLTWIPFNSLIMNIFVEYPWEMHEPDGPDSYRFIRSGIPEYEHLKRIMNAPYQKLVEAHDAAMAALDAA